MTMKIAIIGAGYVGVGVALVYGKSHDIFFYDVDENKINSINRGHSPIPDDEVESFFQHNRKRISGSTSIQEALLDASCCFICEPTPLDAETKRLDTSIVKGLLPAINVAKILKSLQIFIRSTINILDTREFETLFPSLNIHALPEFLREKHVYEDALHPSRIIVGGAESKELEIVVTAYLEGIENKPECVYVSNEEAFAIKLFSNSYLATRVAFFNEIDSYAEAVGLDSSKIIYGMGLDQRIGDHYNTPSSGFGGKCLPKDVAASATMLKESGLETTILEAVTISNEERKKRHS